MEKIEGFRRLSMHDLKRLGMLRDGFNGSIYWTSGGEKVASIGLFVRLSGDAPTAVLHYTLTGTGEKVADAVKLCHLKSNLPDRTGGYWMFVCPVTGRPCRMLYLHDGHFKSRKALPPGTVYECQTYTGYSQLISRALGYGDTVEALDEMLRKPYAKELYRGKPTRLTKRLMKVESRYEWATKVFLSASRGKR